MASPYGAAWANLVGEPGSTAKAGDDLAPRTPTPEETLTVQLAWAEAAA